MCSSLLPARLQRVERGGDKSVDCSAGGTRGNTTAAAAAAAPARSARGYGGGGGPGQVFGSV